MSEVRDRVDEAPGPEALLAVESRILFITLNRPAVRNALSQKLLALLNDEIVRAGDNEQIRAIVIRGSGPSFCSGYDISPAAWDSSDEGAEPETDLFQALWNCPIPVIAQVHGSCLAAGTDLVLHCDLVVCALDTKIGYPAVRAQGVPETHMWLYGIGPQWAKRLLYTGDTLSGAKAVELGLAVEAVPAQDLDSYVRELAQRISNVPREILVTNKQVVQEGLELMGRTTLQRVAHEKSVAARLYPSAQQFEYTARTAGVRQAVADRDAAFGADTPIV